MATKSETGLYPQTETLPNAPPQYEVATAPVVQQYAPAQNPSPQTVYVMSAPTNVTLGANSCHLTCPSCHQVQMTKTNYVNSTKTHIFALILCLTTCCCCIPYCIDSCKSTQHSCSSCGAYLGTYNF